jgi:hypothetical protein
LTPTQFATGSPPHECLRGCCNPSLSLPQSAPRASQSGAAAAAAAGARQESRPSLPRPGGPAGERSPVLLSSLLSRFACCLAPPEHGWISRRLPRPLDGLARCLLRLPPLSARPPAGIPMGTTLLLAISQFSGCVWPVAVSAHHFTSG